MLDHKVSDQHPTKMGEMSNVVPRVVKISARMMHLNLLTRQTHTLDAPCNDITNTQSRVRDVACHPNARDQNKNKANAANEAA